MSDTSRKKSSQRSQEQKPKAVRKSQSKGGVNKGAKNKPARKQPTPKALEYPKHSIEKALRIPKAIIEQNAGKECSQSDAARFVGVGNNSPFKIEISSAKKYSLLERVGTQRVEPTDLAKQIIRPQTPDAWLTGIREAVIQAPLIGDVYKHYRGENLPDRKFFENALVDTFRVPADKVDEFIEVFTESLITAKLLEKVGDKYRILDISTPGLGSPINSEDELKKLAKGTSITGSDTCFVMMPFAPPLGDYYQQVYEPAIQKAGLTAIRADNELFGPGKIIDQIWTGINAARVLVAELTKRNPNVYYELGIAHALRKPVVLVCSNEDDVPFDLKHIRVIYYNTDDPFWGSKLIDKIAENILSALKSPEEAVLFK